MRACACLVCVVVWLVVWLTVRASASTPKAKATRVIARHIFRSIHSTNNQNENSVPREVLSLPIIGDLSMHLRRANLNEAQVCVYVD